MDYIGEHLLPGQLGHFFIVLSLVASLVATFAYFKSARAVNIEDSAHWKKLARYSFITEAISVLAIFIILFYIIYNHLFEYHYAWKHSSRSLELKYLLACFWEGQEGSFLLWSVWHCVLGLILIKKSKQWEAPVMTVISFAQFALATMIAGIYFFGWKMGSNPFILLRDSGVLDNAAALHVNFDVSQPLRADYMASIKDGNDLNPLLQNYWMVIHPPVLFMGFASTIVPFAYAIAGLWKKQLGEWTKPALPWALFSAAVLGVGIMMGAMWAYESLTFGGYWAWDPVENASLVPWMILIAGIHTLLIYKHSGYSLRSTYLFFILAFGFVLYSTFLTRSGILGESSVHAFTDLGMNIQLYMFMYLLIWLPAILVAKNFKQSRNVLMASVILLALIYLFNLPWLGLIALLTGIGILVYHIQTQVPAISKEENSNSREFWMFIGSLVFFLSAIVIIGKTSLPVFNKVFGLKIAPPEDAEYAYNSIQVYVAVIVALLTAITQYLKYKSTPWIYFRNKILLPTAIAVIVSALLFLFADINYTKKGPVFYGSIWLAVICSIYTVIANTAYIWLGLKGKLKLSGGSVAHIGFGMVLIGILISSSNKEVLSNNINGIPVPLGEGEDPGENLTLVKDVTMDMGKYSLTYLGDSSHPKKQLSYYKIHFKSKDGKEEFTLMPNSFVNYKGNEGLMSNPDARHYWGHDVFTYITSISNPDKEKDTSSFRSHTLKPGDSLFYSNGFMVLQGIKERDSLPVEIFGENGKLFEAPVKIFSKTGSIYTVTSRLAFAKDQIMSLPDTLSSESLILQLQKADNKSVEIGVRESGAVMKYVTIKAYKFPFIRLLWGGVIITAIGILMSMYNRIRLNRSSKTMS
ncbi:MAG TPA: cytochrome c biogenesis protein CcsA [Chitinophagaceae bacterium]|nr:cytochrome c biogenesis protein CcsA [Chitinophagaceae bacterium]